MSRYDSIDCPICGKPLNNGDEVVVCPECGAPYHRACYSEEGHCIFPELHEKGEAWQAPQKEEKYNSPAGVYCSRCGTLNPPHGLFCQVCGNQLNNPANPEQPKQPGQPNGQLPPSYGPFGAFGPDGRPINPNPQNPYANQKGQPYPPPFGGPGGAVPPEIPPNPYMNPFGGVAPDEEIDGVPAKDLAIFVNRNSHYFLPRFKQLTQTKAKLINWSAFLFEGGYFLYRKMYGLGILFIAIDVLISIPTALITLQQLLSGAPAGVVSTGATTDYAAVNLICGALAWGIRFFCGFFANSFYFSHCKKKIAEEKAAQQSDDEYYAALSRKGSVAIKLVTGLAIGYMALYMFSVLYMLFTMGGV